MLDVPIDVSPSWLQQGTILTVRLQFVVDVTGCPSENRELPCLGGWGDALVYRRIINSIHSMFGTPNVPID